MESEERIVEERKKKFIRTIKNNPAIIFGIVLIILVILGFYIRYLPLTDHNPNVAGVQSGLWDITTNDYTLGPDLDPFLFLRYAKTMINNGSLPVMDNLRNVPLGFDTTTELQMVPYFIVITYKIINLFGTHSINFAGAFMPVWVFCLTIVAFFLFVFEIFRRKNEDEKENKSNKIKAGLIASISTLFMIILPGFLSRTVAGIPEKEAVGFLFMFLTFWLFLKMWKSDKKINSYIFGLLAGVSTALMGLSWGGVTYLYVTIGLSSLIFFILNKFDVKRIIGYGLWLLASIIVLMMATNRFSLKGFVLGIDTGISCFVLIALIFNLIIWNTKIKDYLKLDNIKIPKTIVTLIILAILGIIASFFISPTFLIDKLIALKNTLITPITGRWNTTVAENAQPYFTQWVGNFGKYIFWLFFAGSCLLFYKMFSYLKRKEKITLTSLYILFFVGLVFSRYAPHPALLDGENFISKLFYFGSALLLVGTTVYFYIKYNKEKDFSFEKAEAEYILLFVLFVLTLFTARSAVRLIMVLVPIAPIFLSYLIVELGWSIKGDYKKEYKFLFVALVIIIALISMYSAYGYYNNIKAQAYNYVPYYYTYQWQEAMSWVRDNTPVAAVFAHWWDYGYWVQSLGNRATVTDGGNAIAFWNYYVGRNVLTGDNQKDSLEFLKMHNASYLLIDSSDIGKYGAFSQIGSDGNFDRLSMGPITIVSDQKQIQETKNELIRTYYNPSGTGVSVYPIEEDMNYTLNGSKKVFFKENTGFIGFTLKYTQNNGTFSFKQPEAIFTTSTNQQINIPLRYLYFQGKLMDFKTGIEAAAYVIEKVDPSSTGTGLTVDSMGAAIYLSPRILRGFLGQVYILDNTIGNFPNFQLAHSQKDFLIEQLNNQGATLGDFVYYYGLRGPIKIWSIKYSGTEKYNADYLLKQQPSYITWKF